MGDVYDAKILSLAASIVWTNQLARNATTNISLMMPKNAPFAPKKCQIANTAKVA
jgi:hypothetical protein